MSDFDPYYKWLGIPPQEQPPNHYRLLGLQLLEQNLEVIASAANRQMAYLQELSSGDDHVDEAQRLLGEVARARVCLLAAESKARYDAEIVSTLDSLPEAEEATPESVAAPEFDSADRDAAAPRRPATRRSGGKKRTSTARRSGRRSPSTPSGPRGTAEEEDDAATPSGSSSLQVKIMAAVIPGVVVVVIGIVWMVAGGDSSSKQGAKNDKENKTGSEASPGQGDNKDPLEAARNKNFGNQAGDNGSNRPPKPVVKPPKADSGPDKPSEPPAAAPIKEPDDAPSELEQAEALLNSKGLKEAFNSTWELKDLTAAYDEANNASPNSSSAAVEQEIERRLLEKKKTIVREAIRIAQSAANPNDLTEPMGRLMGISNWMTEYRLDWGFVVDGLQYMDTHGKTAYQQFNVVAIPFDADEARIRQDVLATMGSPNTEANTVAGNLARELADKYSKLEGNEEVRQALNAVGGKLAESPVLPNTSAAGANSIASNSSPAASSTSSASAGSDSPPPSEPPPKEPEPTLSFAELKDQLTALEKETKLSLGAFNKGAKEYIKQKKDLVKRIKAGEALYARRAKIQDGIQYPEKKTEFGQETDAKVTKPLQALKVQRQKLSKPDAAAMEGNLSRAEKLLEQIKTTPEYAANQKSIAGLAETIAKYRNTMEVQQAKMAK